MEGVELVGEVGNAKAEPEEVAKKPKKVRAKVRFGGDEDEDEKTGGAGDHGHNHSHESHGGHKPMVRHDRPDLYEF